MFMLVSVSKSADAHRAALCREQEDRDDHFHLEFAPWTVRFGMRTVPPLIYVCIYYISGGHRLIFLM